VSLVGLSLCPKHILESLEMQERAASLCRIIAYYEGLLSKFVRADLGERCRAEIAAAVAMLAEIERAASASERAGHAQSRC
jgi:hypothetical protein